MSQENKKYKQSTSGDSGYKQVQASNGSSILA